MKAEDKLVDGLNRFADLLESGKSPPPDPEMVERSRQAAREGRVCTIDEILEGLDEGGSCEHCGKPSGGQRKCDACLDSVVEMVRRS